MANNTRFLSIIIPCYNVADYLIGTIDSLRNLKDAEDCEFIFINDGSTDNTLAIIQDFAKTDNRVLVINKKNAGVSAARNDAIQIASGLYILPLDGDDRLAPQAISIIKNSIKNADMLICPVQIVTEGNIIDTALPFREGEYTPYTLFKAGKSFPTAPKLVYKTSILKTHDIKFNENIHAGEVLTFSLNFLKYCNTIKVSHNSFYQYVMRETSAIHAPNFKKDLTVLDIIDAISINTDSTITHLPSFWETLFKMCASFTYNKYAKLGLKDGQTIDVIKNLLHHDGFKYLLKKLSCSIGHYTRDRLLAVIRLYRVDLFRLAKLDLCNELHTLSDCLQAQDECAHQDRLAQDHQSLDVCRLLQRLRH